MPAPICKNLYCSKGVPLKLCEDLIRIFGVMNRIAPRECSEFPSFRLPPVKLAHKLDAENGRDEVTNNKVLLSLKRNRRQYNNNINPEDLIWENPCNDPNYNFTARYVELVHIPYNETAAVKLAVNIAILSFQVMQRAEAYKDEFAATFYSYSSFDRLLEDKGKEEWLRSLQYYKEAQLPPEKKFNVSLTPEFLKRFVPEVKTRSDIIKDMYKGLKLVLGGMYEISQHGFEEIILDRELKPKIDKTLQDLQHLLCFLERYLVARGSHPWFMLKTEEPTVNKDNMVLIYRDSLMYLEYIAQAFAKVIK